MKLNPTDIFNEYKNALQFKSTLGDKGLYEQARINERFYAGDQWYGAKCGNDRPLVRHNIIKRIGDFKMSQIVGAPISVSYSADGIPNIDTSSRDIKRLRQKMATDSSFAFSGKVGADEINVVMSALSDYRKLTAERVGLDSLCMKALKKAYISGSSVLYTYWDSTVSTGLYSDDAKTAPIKGDISCEVLDIENVYFGDPYCEDVQRQPYIILATRMDVATARREAKRFGADSATLSLIEPDGDDGKVLTLTRLWREYKDNGESAIFCAKCTEKAMIRREFNTRLRMYPLAVFRFEERNGIVYGDSEITYLIPNQIAINRMITANVWAAMSMGMPIMVVNGDTVTADITNDPGQIIKIYGSNEDVEGAVKYVTPPDFSAAFGDNVNNLIDNTLTQSGANAAALGDSEPNNASALITLRNAAIMPLTLTKNRFYCFMEELARIWADFWITQYGDRYIKIEDENGVWYMPFSAQRYANLYLTAKITVGPDTVYSVAESVNTLSSLYEKGVITRRQYLKRLPEGVVPDVEALIAELDSEEVASLDG